MKTTIQKVLFGVLAVGALAVSGLVAAVSQPVRPDHATLGNRVPSVDVPVEVKTEAPNAIELAPVLITAPAPAPRHSSARVIRASTPCEFAWRNQAQGPETQQVRGFCGG